MTEPTNQDEPAAQPLSNWLAIALVTGTSAAVLVLEILAGRLLAPYVGVSLETFTGIIGTILGGIPVGAWAGGVAADRLDPRRLIPSLMVLGGALSISSIPIVRVLGEGSGSGGGVRILVLTAFGFLPMATVLSAVPPAVVKLQLRDLASTGSTVGQLSAWSTAGALFGTFFTGFVLVSTASVTTLIVAVGAALMVAGVVLFVVDRSAGRSSAPGAVTTEMLGIGGLAAFSLLGVAVTDSPCERQTTYYCVSIVEDPNLESGRTLVLDDLTHSYVDLDDPTLLEFWYVRRLIDGIDAHVGTSDAPIDVVYLGGGAFTIPRYVRETRPGSEQTILEIDGDLVEIVEDRLGFEPGDDIDIQVGDGRLTFAELADDSADVVVGDAFGSRSVPFHLATEEFFVDVARVLRDDGVYVANIIDGPSEAFLRAEAATVAEVFEHVAVVRGPGPLQGRLGNSVVIASDASLDLDELGRLLAGDVDPSETPEELADSTRIVGELVAGDALPGYLDGATILTDDFAPVDQLLNRG
ncbi:MAG: fused MFS/spermidine synthase [Ilumatobacter sp.]